MCINFRKSNVFCTYAAVSCLLCGTIAQALVDAPGNFRFDTSGSQSYPDASNTGVPPGTVLTPSRSLTVTTAGAIIDALDISGTLTIKAPNVTVRRTRIRASSGGFIVTPEYTGFVLEDSEIDCLDNSGNGVILQKDAIIRRVNIHSCENGLHVNGPGQLLDSYIHDLWTGEGDHSDGLQFDARANNVIVRGNTIDPNGNTSAIIMYVGSGTTQNHHVWIENNRLIGGSGSFTLYTPRYPGGSDIYINNNRFMPATFGILGSPLTYVTEFYGNVRDDNGNPL